MVEPRQSAMQRIQVGVVGLVVVLLFVSLANMVLDRVTGGQPATAVPDNGTMSADGETVPDEPLRRIGGYSRRKRRRNGQICRRACAEYPASTAVEPTVKLRYADKIQKCGTPQAFGSGSAAGAGAFAIALRASLYSA